MMHPIANIVFEIALLIGLAGAALIWTERRRIWAALRRDDRQPPRSRL